MSNINEAKWYEIDKDLEEAFVDGVRFVRPKNDIALSLDCTVCKNLICTIEDVEIMKKEGVCEDCYTTYYYNNKEKWEKGWRPEIFK
tara:strand:+ start:395 stop:655 length:261 start_codon:yes stop_codon:yes gene_type:complete